MDDGAMGGVPPPIHGETRLFAIVGDPIRQVGSPAVFNARFRAEGRAAVLVPLHVTADGFGTCIDGLRQLRNLDGIIVTVPHKVAALAVVDAVEAQARRIGAVNAIRREGHGRLVGANFDGIGCTSALRADGHRLRGRRALIIGAGGAGAAVAHALADEGIAALALVDTDKARARALAASIEAAHVGLPVWVATPEPEGFDLVVNCTPLGSRPDDPHPVPVERLDAGTLVVDVLLQPRLSRWLEAAAARGLATQPGHRMLEGQAAAIAAFFGMTP